MSEQSGPVQKTGPMPNQGSVDLNDIHSIEDEFSKDDVYRRLQVIAKTNPQAVQTFAIRAALRIFPLLAAQGPFPYWGEDKRIAQHLLVLYQSLIGTLSFISDLTDGKRAIRPTSDKIDQVLKLTQFDEQSENVRYCLGAIQYAVRASSVSAPTRIARAATEATFHCVQASSQYFSLAAIVLEDLGYLERGASATAMIQRKLWNSGVPGEMIDILDNAWGRSLLSLQSMLQETDTSLATSINVLEKDIEQLFLKDFELGGVPIPSDMPSQGPAQRDALNRSTLVQGMAEFLTHRNNNEHQTIGLLGHWGVGKSSVVNLLKNELHERQKDSRFLVGEFNAWTYEHTPNLQAGVAQELFGALTSKSDHEFILIWWLKRFFISLELSVQMYPWRMFFLLSIIAIPLVLGFAGMLPNIERAAAGAFGIDTFWMMLSGSLAYSGVLYASSRKILSHSFTKELKTYVRLPDYAKELGMIPVMQQQIKILCDIRLNRGWLPQWLKAMFRFNPVSVVGRFLKRLFQGSALDVASKRLGLQWFAHRLIGLFTRKPKKLLFVIDDMDRCEPASIVKVFEAIRLVLEVERVFVLIAVDERIALSALALHYQDVAEYHPNKDPRAIARDYLGKIIQLPISLQAPDATTTGAYLQAVWKDQDADFHEWNTLHQTFYHGFHGDATGAQLEHVTAPVNSTEAPASTETLDDPGDIAFDGELSTYTELLANLHHEQDDLSREQKAAFVFWTQHFCLNNPRQLKRLYNSYNLLCKVLGEDIAPENSPEFPKMMLLVAFEFLNDCQALANRERVLESLRKGEMIDFTLLPTQIRPDMWDRLIEDPQLPQKIECFVLPDLPVDAPDQLSVI